MNSFRNEDYCFDTIEMPIQTMSVSMSDNVSLIHPANIEFTYHKLYGILTSTLTTRMAGRVVEEHEYPNGWIEAVKERWLPKWAKRIWPVMYISVKTWQCYPEYKIEHMGRPIQMIHKKG